MFISYKALQETHSLVKTWKKCCCLFVWEEKMCKIYFLHNYICHFII